MANPFPFVAGDVLTAAELNGIGEAWTSYTPVIKGGGTTVTATLNYAKYLQINKLVFVQVNAELTSAGAAGGVISVSMPSGLLAVSQQTFRDVGVFQVADVSGVAYYHGVAVAISDEFRGISNNVTNFMGNQGPTLTLASGDFIALAVCYEVA
jgi:hypothetical protein